MILLVFNALITFLYFVLRAKGTPLNASQHENVIEQLASVMPRYVAVGSADMQNQQHQ